MNDDREDLLKAIRMAAQQTTRSYLTLKELRDRTGIPETRIYDNFDSWPEACAAAGVEPGKNSPDNLTPRRSKGKDHAISELKRIAQTLSVDTLSKSQFDSQDPEVKASTVSKLCDGWDKALEAAGLKRHRLFYDEIPLGELAEEFLRTFRELGGVVPKLRQLSRRSKHCTNSFTRKFGGYPTFKQKAIEFLLASTDLEEETRAVISSHLDELCRMNGTRAEAVYAPHARGRHLGFRAFAFSPTYEAEVVSLFSSVADELGFEIVAQRAAFPDCEARRIFDRRRPRYRTCMIEFEYRSSDYRKHKHPQAGCDLVVCWIHDWADCPLEVMELQTTIRDLPGWK